MTVHVHTTISGIHHGGHGHTRDKVDGAKVKGARREDLDTERTWAFDCTPKCEQRTVAAHPLTASGPASVALTFDEEREKAELESRANLEVGKLAQALSQVANERVTATAAAKGKKAS